MSIRNLHLAFHPGSVAVVGASRRSGAVGAVVMRNMIEAGFEGQLWPVNPKGEVIEGRAVFPTIADLPAAPDLAVITAPPAAVPGAVAQLAARGCRAIVVITAGLGRGPGSLLQDALDAARPSCARLFGPNCLGLISPLGKVNASFSHITPPVGDIAFVSQSGAILCGVMDWAVGRRIGFSHMVSLGDMGDVDFGDMLDYLGADPRVKSILMYVESIVDARKFMSAARAAARVKPVIAMKTGRSRAGARAAASHTGALAGDDDAYDAAFRRAGIMRVNDLPELFGAVETLSRAHKLRGDRLAILTNGGGQGVLAADRVETMDGKLAELSPETIRTLDEAFPANWSRGNPVDLIGDGGKARYRAGMEALLVDQNVDAVLVMNCPTAMGSGADIAAEVARTAAAQPPRSAKPVLTNWLGEATAREGRAVLSQAGTPTYETPSDAVRGFMYLVERRNLLKKLMETPPRSPRPPEGAREAARGVLAQALSEGRRMLTEPEAKNLLRLYGVPTTPLINVDAAAKVGAAAAEMLRAGEPNAAVVVKILSRDITHKSDVGGVALDLHSAEDAEAAAVRMERGIRAARPDARIEGFSVQPMVRGKLSHEVIVGMIDDRTFGPMILVGKGGVAVEAANDKALAMPPLNIPLALDAIRRTRIGTLLKGYRDRPPADVNAIAEVMIRVQRIAADFPEIKELDINPLLVSEHGVIALDARVGLGPVATAGQSDARFAIRPYPADLAGDVELRDGQTICLRPILPSDEAAIRRLLEALNPEDVRLRFFTARSNWDHGFLARLTQIDYDRAIAFVAEDPQDPNELWGVSRFFGDPERERAEYSVLVRSDLKGRGLGWALMNRLIAHARETGYAMLFGDVLTANTGMLRMCRELGFVISVDLEDATVKKVSLAIKPADGKDED